VAEAYPVPYTPTEADRQVRTQRGSDEALLQTARTRFQRSLEVEDELRREFLIDEQFESNEQWDFQVRQARERPDQNRPCLTLNLMKPAIKQVTNEQRASRPALRVSPTGGGASVEVAQICDGLLRAIQRESDAQQAYDQACHDATALGRGWFRINTVYESPQSFAQKLVIEPIPNCLSVYPQPLCQRADYSDMHWCFIASDMPHDDFLAENPGFSPVDFAIWKGQGDSEGWLTQDTVRVVEYYWRELEDRQLLLLSNGMTIDTRGGTPDDFLRLIPRGVQVVNQRLAQVPMVYWAKLCGAQVLNRTRWLGSWIPIVPVLGDRLYVGDRMKLSGIIRDGRDAQRMVNYWASAEAEAVALAPRAPWVMAAGQDEGFETEWDTANVLNHSVLHYNMGDTRGTQAPPPQRQTAEPAIQALSTSRAMARRDFQDVVGVYDASLGAPSNERSGRAIEVRDKNADTSNAHYLDNFAQYSLPHAGRILIELLPKIYRDPGRVIQIVQPDETEKTVLLNQQHQDPETGLQAFYSLAEGTYAVAVQAGPAYQTQREQSLDFLLNMAKVDPKILQVGDDLVIGQSDASIAKELAARLKKTIPPQLLEDPAADKDAQLAMLSGQLQQVQQQAQALNAHASQVEQALQAAQQQIQKLTMENQAIKADHTADMAEAAAKRQDVELSHMVEMRRLNLEEQRLQMEARRNGHGSGSADGYDSGHGDGDGTGTHEDRLAQIERTLAYLVQMERAEARQEGWTPPAEP